MFQQLVQQQPSLADALSGQLAIIGVEVKRQKKFEELKVMNMLMLYALWCYMHCGVVSTAVLYELQCCMNCSVV